MKDSNNSEHLAKAAANPNTMGGLGAPNGRPVEREQERDMNHPKGTNERAGLPSGRVRLN